MKKTPVAIIFFVASIFCAGAFASPVADVEITGLTTISEDVVRDVINIKPGGEFSEAQLKKAGDRLAKWGVFSIIDTSYSSGPGGVAVRFNLEEGSVVAAIEITGNYPYVENKIRKYLSLHPGDVYTPEMLVEQTEKIKEFYAREGYVGTEVYITEETLPEWGGSVITFNVKHGAEMRIHSIEVHGSEKFPYGKFVSEINPYMKFSERRLANSIRKLRESYKKHGYIKARVKVRSKNMDFEKHRVDIALDVFEGPHVDTEFVGAMHTNRTALKKTITMIESGSADIYELGKSKEALLDFFRDRGYPDAKVDYKKEEYPSGNIRVTFFIHDGKPQKIHRIQFTGNKNVRRSSLIAGMRNRELSFGVSGAYREEDVGGDDEAILTAMKEKGYLSAKVGKWDVKPTKQGYALDITIPIEEGPQTIVEEVSFRGNGAFGVPKLLGKLKMKPGKPLNEPGLEDDRQTIANFYADNGYPYADVKHTRSEDISTNRATIRYEIEEGTLVRIGRIVFMGDVLTSQKAIKNAMEIREGDVFSYKKIIESQLNIRRLGAFASVNIESIGLEEKAETIYLKVKVEEQRPFTVDLGVDYSTADSLTGTLSFVNVNAFGWAKSNSLKLTGGQKLSRAELGWFDPRFLSSSIEMTTTAWIQYKKNPTYTYTQMGGAFGWFRRFRRFGFFTRYELDRDYFVTGSSAAADADSLRNNTISQIALSASYDSRDNFANPKRGFYTMGSANIYNEIKGNEANFVNFGWQGENDLSFLKNHFTLTTSLRFNKIETIGKNVSVPTNELLFLGGADTIRGFAEDALGPQDAQGKATGSRTRWIVNEELRMGLVKTLSFAVFFDMGSLTDDFSQINWNVIRRSVGMGLRYITPVGPIRADYGFKLDRKNGESVGAFNLTFGYIF